MERAHNRISALEEISVTALTKLMDQKGLSLNCLGSIYVCLTCFLDFSGNAPT